MLSKKHGLKVSARELVQMACSLTLSNNISYITDLGEVVPVGPKGQKCILGLVIHSKLDGSKGQILDHREHVALEQPCAFTMLVTGGRRIAL